MHPRRTGPDWKTPWDRDAKQSVCISVCFPRINRICYFDKGVWRYKAFNAFCQLPLALPERPEPVGPWWFLPLPIRWWLFSGTWRPSQRCPRPGRSPPGRWRMVRRASLPKVMNWREGVILSVCLSGCLPPGLSAWIYCCLKYKNFSLPCPLMFPRTTVNIIIEMSRVSK